MQRKTFLKAVSLSAFVNPLIFSKTFQTNENKIEATLKPKRLKKGDTLGLIAPAGFIDKEELNGAVKSLNDLGFKVIYTENILERNGYLAGTDEQRASDVNEMFSRKDIDGVVAVRGGYGCARILPMLDYNLIKVNPKVLIGYSDVTALLFAIYKKTGVICFHGPVGISTFNDYSVYNFKNVLMNPSENFDFYNADESKNSDGEYKPYTIRSGKAHGKLVGGNLSIVVSMIGTPFDIDMSGKIIFLEEVGEDPYRIDRMLTQMKQAGKFESAAGIALGVFNGCDAHRNRYGELRSFTLKEVLFDRLSDLNIPVAYGMSFGHIANKLTLPFGVNAELDTIFQKITLLEPAVL